MSTRANRPFAQEDVSTALVSDTADVEQIPVEGGETFPKEEKNEPYQGEEDGGQDKNGVHSEGKGEQDRSFEHVKERMEQDELVGMAVREKNDVPERNPDSEMKREDEGSEASSDEDTEAPPVSPSILEGKVKLALMAGEERPKDNCPYCNTPEGDYNDIVVLYGDIKPSFIEDMMEHSWWRTGNVLYRPRQQSVCCPSYTLRTDVREFKFTKSHRRVMRRFAEFLANGSPQWLPVDTGTSEHCDKDTSGFYLYDDNVMHHDSGSHGSNVSNNATAGQDSNGLSKVGQKRTHPVSPGKGPDPAKKPCRKAKEIRRERRESKGLPSNSRAPKQEHHKEGLSLREMVLQEQQLVAPKHRLEVELHPVKPPSQKLEDTKEESYQLYEKFQDKIHPGKIRFKDYSQFLWGFCDSCMTNVDDGETLLGTFHQQYYLDGKLVAVSIIDILPHYFVSIYLYYDPDIRFIQPGVYTILRELDFVQELHKKQPSLHYYDLGYYNTLSPKVSYKGQFKPAQVLCPFTLHWCDLDVVRNRLQPHVCARLSDQPRYADGKDEDTRRTEVIRDSIIMFGSNILKFSTLPRMFRDIFMDKMEVLYKQTSPEMMDKLIIVIT